MGGAALACWKIKDNKSALCLSTPNPKGGAAYLDTQQKHQMMEYKTTSEAEHFPHPLWCRSLAVTTRLVFLGVQEVGGQTVVEEGAGGC